MSDTKLANGRLDLELLSAFVEVVDAGGFTRAASRLNRTQSAVSMQIKRLEERVARRLLIRSAHAVELTEDGRVLFDYARRIVDLSEEARTRIASKGLSGQLRLGLAEWCASPRLQGFLARFVRANPNLHLVVRTDASAPLCSAVRSGELDMALAQVECGGGMPEAIHREPLYWVAALGTAIDSNEELQVALFDPPCPYRDIVAAKLAESGPHWRECFRSNSVESIRKAVETGLAAVTVLPETAVQGNLRIVDESEGLPPLPQTDLGIFYSEPGDTELASQIAAHLRLWLRGNEMRPA